jgi:hypothetical protein
MVADAGGIGWLLLVVVVGLVYFAPSILAATRRAPRLRRVIVVNLFFGWTFLGWVAAMVLADRAREDDFT